MTIFKCTPLLPQQCEVCESRRSLLRCSGCRMVYYCGRDHQTVDRESHKRACVATKKAHAAFTEEEISLRNNPGDGGFVLPARVFDDHAGRFWGILGTRDYMRSRFHFVDVVLDYFPHNQVAVQTALDHLMDMLRLNRSDNMGLRNIAPSLMLRLGRDQDAYDFVKWWATCDPDGEYDWGDVKLPYLVTKNADILEEPTWWTDEFLSLSHAAVVILIKLRILLGLLDLQNTARALQASTLPSEIVAQVCESLLGDSPLAGRRGLATADTAIIAAMIGTVRAQIWALYCAMDEANVHIWSLLCSVRYDEGELERPASYSSGSLEEAQYTLLHNYPAWEETPGVLDQIETIWILHTDEAIARQDCGE